MKTLTAMLLAATFMLPVPAKADDYSSARGIAVAFLYDRDCSPLPDPARRVLLILLTDIPTPTMRRAAFDVGREYVHVGRATFCSGMRPAVERFLHAAGAVDF